MKDTIAMRSTRAPHHTVGPLKQAPRSGWRFADRRDGQTAVLEVCGLRAVVQDFDGDASAWTIRYGRTGALVETGEHSDGDHFAVCIRTAEANLRRLLSERLADLRVARTMFA